MKRFTGHDEKWGKFVDVKINASEVLEKELSRHPKKGTALLGSVTDAYQPVERNYKITRAILTILLKCDFPISILTKSDLVTRDIDLLKQFSDCEVGLTVTTLNEDASKKIKPFGSIPQRRVDALKLLHDSGIKTYAFIGPILPGITELRPIFSKLKGKVNFLMAESLNTRCGNWDEVVNIIQKNYPHLAEIYQSKFGKGYWDSIEKEIKKLCLEFEIPLKGFYRH
jgi:DNA repair photolyase